MKKILFFLMLFVSIEVIQAKCDCITRAGDMDLMPTLTACVGGEIQAKHKGNQVNDGNDIGVFVLHEGSGATLLFGKTNNPTGIFQFDPTTMIAGKTYYVSYIMANDDGGFPDTSDKCFSVTPKGQPVRWNWKTISGISASCNTPLCSGATLQLKASGGVSYQWIGPNGFFSNAQNPILNKVKEENSGVYRVIISDASRCADSTGTVLKVEDCIATHDLFSAADVQIFPNPANHNLTISAKENIQKIILSNSLGQNVLIQNVDNKQLTINISAFSKGIYYVKMFLDEKEFKVYKVVLGE